MTFFKKTVFICISIIIGILISLFAAEIVLRLLPVNEGLRAVAVNGQNPIFHFEPNRQAIFAKGALFEIVNKVRTNNYGFVSDQTYVPEAQTPLHAVIGDSYVEALMVPYPETLQARLAEAVKDKGRVYAFAASGTGLAQYLAWARFARDTFHPQSMTFVIIGNDFSESLSERERSPGVHSFAKGPDGHARMLLTEYEPSLVRRIVRHSALAMYLVTQAKVTSVPLAMGDKDVRFVGNMASQVAEDFLADSKWTVDEFLAMLPEYTGLPKERIQVVVDGIRPQMYDPASLEETKGSYWDTMRTYMLTQARSQGYEAIDMHERFMETWARDHRRFEFPTDGHWSGIGHAVAAEAVRKSRVFCHTFALDGCG